MQYDFSQLPTDKLRNLLTAATAEHRRKEFSDNFYFTNGGYDAAANRIRAIESELQRREEQTND